MDTVESLAERLKAENLALHQEVADLRHKIGQLEGRATDRTTPAERGAKSRLAKPITEVVAAADAESKRLVLHLGAHKTGSSSLQLLLRENAAALGAQGIAIVTRGMPRFSEAPHPENYKAAFRQPLLRIATGKVPQKGQQQGHLEQVRAWLPPAVHRARTVLVSDEVLLGAKLHPARSLYPKAAEHVATLQELFPDRKAEVILYIRNTAKMVESCYVESIQLGRSLSFDEYLDEIDIDRLRWTPVVESVADTIGVENLKVIAFEGIQRGFVSFAREFFGLFCDAQHLSIRDVWENPTLSALGCELARRTSPLLSQDQWRRMRRFLQRNFPRDKSRSAAFLSDELRAHLTKEYESESRALIDKYGVR